MPSSRPAVSRESRFSGDSDPGPLRALRRGAALTFLRGSAVLPGRRRPGAPPRGRLRTFSLACGPGWVGVSRPPSAGVWALRVLSAGRGGKGPGPALRTAHRAPAAGHRASTACGASKAHVLVPTNPGRSRARVGRPLRRGGPRGASSAFHDACGAAPEDEGSGVRRFRRAERVGLPGAWDAP